MSIDPPVPASDAEREETARELKTVAEQFDQDTPEKRTLERAAALLRQPAPAAVPDTRNPECVAVWPECCDGEYNPRCCRWPKSCSCEIPSQPPVPQSPQDKEVQP